MKSNLIKRGFISLIASQFFGAANDNILKQVLTFMIAADGIWGDRLGALIGGRSLRFIANYTHRRRSASLSHWLALEAASSMASWSPP